MPEVKIQNLSFSYKKKKQYFDVFSDFSCAFHSQRVSAIVGNSGAGKTTLIKAIIGLIKADGDIFFDDVSLKPFPVSKRNIAYVNQRLSLYPFLSVFNNIAFPLKSCRIDGEEIRKRVNEVSSFLDLESCLARRPKELSIGQQQKVSLARAMIKKPELYIFDEPFSSVDNKTIGYILPYMKDVFSRNKSTVIFITHNLKEILPIVDDIYVLENGKIIASGPKEEMIHNSKPEIAQYLKDLW